MASSSSFKIASVLGASGVILGALGAHSLKGRLMAAGTREIWETAVLYHLVHAVACLAIAGWALSANPDRLRQIERIGICWLIGVLLFSGSLYALALGGPHWVGPLTPLGGLGLIIGWVWLGFMGNSEAKTPKS